MTGWFLSQSSFLQRIVQVLPEFMQGLRSSDSICAVIISYSSEQQTVSKLPG